MIAQIIRADDQIVDGCEMSGNNEDTQVASQEHDDYETTFVEPILRETNDRFTVYPIRYDEAWRLYKQSVAVFWTAEEIDSSEDLRQFDTLKDDERHFIKTILAFFAGADGIVVENLGARFLNEVQVPELRAFYTMQLAMEGIHAEVYALLIETLVRDNEEKLQLFRAIDEIPCVQKKANWARKWISDDTSGFATRLVAFAVVEGIFFSGAFCAIFWLKKRGLMPGLATANSFINRDEGLHTNFACHIYRDLLERKLTQGQVEAIVREAVDVELEFICDALPCALIGMNSDSMSQYIRFVADYLLVNLGHDKIYKDDNPFPFMEQISMEAKSNHFERRVVEYGKNNVMESLSNRMPHEFTLDADF